MKKIATKYATKTLTIRKMNKIKSPVTSLLQDFSVGGDEGDRTPYLLNAIQALSQVSYTPVKHLQLYLF